MTIEEKLEAALRMIARLQEEIISLGGRVAEVEAWKAGMIAIEDELFTSERFVEAPSDRPEMRVIPIWDSKGFRG